MIANSSQSRFRPRCERLESRDTPGAGALDTTFGTGGIVTGPLSGQPEQIARQPDGKLVVAVDSWGQDFSVVRYNVDGTLDPTFGTNGVVYSDFNHHSDSSSSVLIQPDGKILVGGLSYDSLGGNFALARYNADGSPDATFGIGGKVETEFNTTENGIVSRQYGSIGKMALYADGRILVAGGVAGDAAAARYTANGQLDDSFGTNGFLRPDLEGQVSGMAIQPDGKTLLAGGTFSSRWLVRLNVDGTTDPSFVAPGASGLVPVAVWLQTDGKIVLAGHEFFSGFSGGDGDYIAVARFNADGILDTGFGNGGRTLVNVGAGGTTDLMVQSDGKIVVTGYASPGFMVNQFVVVRFDANGNLDPTFGDNGMVTTNVGVSDSAVMQADGKIVVAGNSFTAPTLTLVRYLNDGTPADVPPGGPLAPQDAGSPSASAVSTHLIAVGAGDGGGPHVIVYDAQTGAQKFSFFAYDPSFTGGVRVATGDVNGDGVDDIITAAGANGGPHVKVFDGTTGNLIREFMAYDLTFTGGVNVAVGDVNQDGHADIITGAGEGGGPHVKVFDGKTGNVLASFMAYDLTFTGGVRVAAGDVTGDGIADLITGAGPTGGPHVKVFDGKMQSVVTSFFAGPEMDFQGVFVAAGDVDRNGRTDIVVSRGLGFGSALRVYTRDGGQSAADQIAIAGPVAPIAAVDREGDGYAEIVTGSASQQPSKILTWRTDSGEYFTDATPFDGFLGGVFVG